MADSPFTNGSKFDFDRNLKQFRQRWIVQSVMTWLAGISFLAGLVGILISALVPGSHLWAIPFCLIGIVFGSVFLATPFTKAKTSSIGAAMFGVVLSLSGVILWGESRSSFQHQTDQFGQDEVARELDQQLQAAQYADNLLVSPIGFHDPQLSNDAPASSAIQQAGFWDEPERIEDPLAPTEFNDVPYSASLPSANSQHQNSRR